MKADRRQLVEDGAARHAEPFECLARQHAGAVDGFANRVVLFDELDAKALGSEAGGRVEARGTAADDHDVSCVRHWAEAETTSNRNVESRDYRRIREPWYQAIVRARPSRKAVVARKPKSAAARDVSRQRRG